MDSDCHLTHCLGYILNLLLNALLTANHIAQTFNDDSIPNLLLYALLNGDLLSRFITKGKPDLGDV